MYQKIISKRVELPPIYLVETKEDWDAVPLGIPKIIGTKADLPFILIYLEFQVLWKSCTKTGIPIKWLDCLRRIGFKNNIKEYVLQSGGEYWSADNNTTTVSIDEFVSDKYIVDFDRLSELKILPVWLDDLKTAVECNIINEVQFDPCAYNKQLGMNIGNGVVKTHKRNLIINDISGSIPDAVRVTLIQLSKLMSKRFHADLIFTGGSTVFIDYDDVFTSDINEITSKISRNNEGEQYKAIVEQPKDYATVIAFGDNDSPMNFSKIGKLEPKFKIENIYSLHTDNTSDEVVGYAKYLKSINKPVLIKDWLNTISK